MSWNYRLMKHKEPDPEDTWYAVHEVFYTDEGKIWAWTENPITFVADSKEEALRVLDMIKKDVENQEVLDADMEPEGQLEDDYEDDDLCPKCKSPKWGYYINFHYWECSDCGYVEHTEEHFLD